MNRPRGVSFEGMTVGLLFAVVAVRAFLMPAQSDTFWHLRTGADILASGHIPRVDAYSYTAAGLPWPDHEWLWQVFVYALHCAGGMPLVTAGAALLVLSAVAVVYHLMVGRTSTRFWLLLVAIPLASLVWVQRPQIFTLLGLASLTWLLARERFALIPILVLVWANVHGGVILGDGVLALAWAVAALRAWLHGAPADRRRLAWLTAILPLAALATAATPLGFGFFRFVRESEARLREAHINEWRATLPGFSIGGVFWALALAFAVLVVRRWRALRGASWADWIVVAVALALFPLAFRSIRHIGPFLLLAPAAASRLLGGELPFGRRRERPASPDHPLVNLTMLGAAALAGVAAIAIGWTRPFEDLGWRPLPAGVLAGIRACPGRLYNHYNEGGYLLWLTPERPVFIDNRQDPYPLPFLLDHLRVESAREPYGRLFAQWGIRCSFLGVDSPTVAALSRDGWRDVYRDDKWAVQASPAPREPR
jgi:hypothetical protein